MFIPICLADSTWTQYTTFFLSASWLHHDQLWATVEGAASIMQCESLRLILTRPKGHWQSPKKVGSQSSESNIKSLFQTKYHILVYLMHSGEVQKCSFQTHDLTSLTWVNLKPLFSFFNELPQTVNFPSCCVLDAWNALPGCHSNLSSQILDVPDIILIFWLKIADIVNVDEKKREQILESIKQITIRILFQNIEGKHKEEATCVSDLIVGLTYMNRLLFPCFTLY